MTIQNKEIKHHLKEVLGEINTLYSLWCITDDEDQASHYASMEIETRAARSLLIDMKGDLTPEFSVHLRHLLKASTNALRDRGFVFEAAKVDAAVGLLGSSGGPH